jgi:phosphatidylinositol alpha-1,6-mannosyltransferase
VTGHVVGGRDLPALVDALVGLLTDPGRARAMGAAGREWMVRDWALPALVERLRGVLDGLPPRSARSDLPARGDVHVRP